VKKETVKKLLYALGVILAIDAIFIAFVGVAYCVYFNVCGGHIIIPTSIERVEPEPHKIQYEVSGTAKKAFIVYLNKNKKKVQIHVGKLPYRKTLPKGLYPWTNYISAENETNQGYIRIKVIVDDKTLYEKSACCPKKKVFEEFQIVP
jgi:hypothetical protein